MTISPIYNSQLYILRYTTKAKVKNEPFCQTRKINIRIKFYLFCRTHAFEHHRYIVEFYITKLSIQCSLPMCPCTKMITSEDMAQLLMDNLYKQFSLPDKIISDRGPQFVAKAFRKY